VDNGITGNEYIVMLAKSPEAKDSLKAEVKNIFERVVQQNSGNNKFKIIIMEHWEHALYMYNIYLNEENKENNFLAGIQKYLYAILAFLFIPAINLSGMISTRMSSRMDEVGVRKAYGATDRQIVSQVLWENLLLTLVGAIIGLALSYVTICSGHRWLMTILDTRIHTAPVSGITAEMLFNPTVVTMVLLVTFVLNIASALIPTLLALRNNIIESLYQRR
jgi:ABC-type antimicrobial peptide transport system permease subunit